MKVQCTYTKSATGVMRYVRSLDPNKGTVNRSLIALATNVLPCNRLTVLDKLKACMCLYTDPQIRSTKIVSLIFCALDMCRSKITGMGKMNKPISERIFKTASATNIAVWSMQLPLKEISHAFETGRQAKTKEQIMTKDPTMVEVDTASKE